MLLKKTKGYYHLTEYCQQFVTFLTMNCCTDVMSLLTELDVHERRSLVASQGPHVQLVHRLNVLQLQEVLSNSRCVQMPGSA